VLDSQTTELDLPQLFREPLLLQRMQGEIYFQHSGTGWRIAANDVQVANEDIQLAVDAELDLPMEGEHFLDLRGRFRQGQGVAVPNYLPARIMPKSAVAWLDAAFRQGQVPEGGVLFHGPLAAFPFDGQEGRFEVAFVAEDVELFLMPGWPLLSKANAQVRFLNRGMTIDATGGRIYDSLIGATQVRINDFHAPVLQVRGVAQVHENDGLRILRETPLRKQLGEYVSQLSMAGRSDLQLEFALPLDESAVDSSLRVNGHVGLQGNQLRLGKSLLLEDVVGQLDFSEKGLQAKDLQVRMLQGKANVSIQEQGSGSDAKTVFTGRGSMQPAALQSFVDLSFFRHMHGSTSWQASLMVPHGKGKGREVSLHVASDLRGMQIDLPYPLTKPAEQTVQFTLEQYFSGAQDGLLYLQYGDVLAARLQLDDDGGVRRGGLHFGHGAAELPKKDEWHIGGSLRELDMSSWRHVFTDSNTAGDLPVRVAMDELQLLPAVEESKTATHGRLPSMQVDIQRFAYGEIQLGELSFALQSSPAVVQLDDLSLQGELIKLVGHGRWQLYPRSYSEAKLQLNSPDFGHLLKEWQVASSISRGTMQSDLELNWPGRLSEWELAKLDGHMRFEIQDGKLDEVDPGAGRLLGLFSLQALPRRLLLDFSDLFQQGLWFSNIKGDVRIQTGDAFTTNMVMDTDAAEIRINGRTGFIKRDYDQHISVVPNLSGSAPLVGALAFGPQVGAVALLLQRLFRKNINEAARTEYYITGTWEEPKIEKITPVTAGTGASNTHQENGILHR